MSFRPVLLQSGLAGWVFLQRTYDSQMTAFRKAPARQSEAEYFTENIKKASTAADLVADRRLLNVALRAFGLGEDINNRAFIQRILEDGTASPNALANRLTDSRYKALSDAFGFGPEAIPRTQFTALMEEVVDKYWTRSFQAAVGEQDNDTRIALYAQGALAAISGNGGGDTAQWFTAIGDPPLRQLFETAFALPSSFSQIDLDRQLEVFQDKLRSLTGSDRFDQFAEVGPRDRLISRFLAMSQVNSTSSVMSGAATALTLLGAR
ncbi:MAG TPA: flagellar protein [Rhodobacteraceae bacterium]|nr:flagellar protein [Paracoccaceae bacterium]